MTGSAAGRPAFYAVGAGTGGLRDWLTLLHPPYTAWHLSYVAMGAALAPDFTVSRLIGALVAFFLAVGIAAHALDELAGRPLRTGISSAALVAAAGVGLGAAVVLGVLHGGLRLAPFIVAGVLLVLAYNLEWGSGAVHTSAGFALGWGAFPVLTGYYAQDFRLGAAAGVAAMAAFFTALAQRTLSTPARALRRRTASASGVVVYRDGTETRLGRGTLLVPLETALRTLTYGHVLLAVALVSSRL